MVTRHKAGCVKCEKTYWKLSSEHFTSLYRDKCDIEVTNATLCIPQSNTSCVSVVLFVVFFCLFRTIHIKGMGLGPIIFN